MKDIVKTHILHIIAEKVNYLSKDLDIKETHKTTNIKEFNIRPKVKETNPSNFCIMSPQNIKIMDVHALLNKEKTPVPKPLLNILSNMNVQIEFTDSFKRHGVTVKFIKKRPETSIEKTSQPLLE